MPGITKARYQEVAATAAQIVTEAGGLTIDKMQQSERLPLLRELASKLVEAEQVDRRTARSHIARTFRRMRYKALKSAGWGGKRPGAGAPVGNSNAATKQGDKMSNKKQTGVTFQVQYLDNRLCAHVETVHASNEKIAAQKVMRGKKGAKVLGVLRVR